MVNVKINGIEIAVEENSTILDACKKLDIFVPTLCYMDFTACGMENRPASCRVCVVEVKGRRNLAPACATPVFEGMEVYTNSIRALRARKLNVELLLSDHTIDCPICEKNGRCELQKISDDLGIRKIRFEGGHSKENKYVNSLSISRNASKCILCGRCVKVCNDVQKVGVYSAINRGFGTQISTAFNIPMDESTCTSCGQCVAACPTGALIEVSNLSEVWKELENPNKTVIVQIAPAVRSALNEEFNVESKKDYTGKIVAALKQIGFNKVFDTNFAADVTIFEEATELVERLKSNKNLPLITSCCPGWINFIEKFYPDMLNLPSSCKSPHEMFGAIAKSYYCESNNIDPKNLVVVSVMPCTAKKDEIDREQLVTNGFKDVDYVLTTRELGQMIKEMGIDCVNIKEVPFDEPLGKSSGASDIFGFTGGVMEAALRTANLWINGDDKPLEIKQLHEIEGIKISSINLMGKPVKVAVASGLGNARKVLDQVRAGELDVQAIEIMACPGGCVNGGGQPYTQLKINKEVIQRRIKRLQDIDQSKKIRISADNQAVNELYEQYLGNPGGKLAHRLLHTTYKAKLPK